MDIIRIKSIAFKWLLIFFITFLQAACGGGGGGNSNQAPTAVFSATPTSGDAPLLVVVDASGSSDSDGRIVSYTWNFGNGGNDSGVTSSTTYNNPASYTITLTITDNEGDTATATISVGVSSGTTKAIDQQIFEKYGRAMDSVNYTLAYQSGQATVMGNASSGNHAMFLIAGQTIPPGAMMSGHYVLQGGFFIETP